LNEINDLYDKFKKLNLTEAQWQLMAVEMIKKKMDSVHSKKNDKKEPFNISHISHSRQHLHNISNNSELY
jgi:hypothetical protein